MKIIKRNGQEVTFSKSNIVNALNKANQKVRIDARLTNDEIKEIAKTVEDLCKKETHIVNVEDIQNFVEKEIMARNNHDVAKEYITYRYQRMLDRQKNTTDDKVLALLQGQNEEILQENANKNPKIASTMRDYMAGEMSKDISKRYLIPADIVKAHEEGIIHFHDMDYFAQPIHNCFSGDTGFVTWDGIRTFNSFQDGDTVKVLDKDCEWREATVHTYGMQEMQTVTFVYDGAHSKEYHSVMVTKDHRWILKDGSVTTNLSVGDVLYGSDTDEAHWVVDKIEPEEGLHEAWCVVEPVTHSFYLEEGIVTGNCDLWNLEDMLQNGTVINGVKIEKPHTFLTACTIASQCSAIIASSQFGGQTFTLAHLAPFVEDTRNYFRARIKENDASLTEEQVEKLVEFETRKNIKDGVQTLQYQLLTISSTNGQTPFVSVCMYLNEAKNEKEKEDLALVIEEVLRQRIQGVKDKEGNYFTNAFPKLLYMLEEDNTKPGDKYYYLTELAVECTMKRMVPDYISEKVMKSQKKDKDGNGYCFPSMGCVAGDSEIRVHFHTEDKTLTIEDFWKELEYTFNPEPQFGIKGNPNLEMVLEDVQIWDNKEDAFVDCPLIIRNKSSEWIRVRFVRKGMEYKTLEVTPDHVFTLKCGNNVEASRLKVGESIFDGYEVESLTPFRRDGYSYDVTTESAHFMVNGLYSHNCRSFLSVWKDTSTPADDEYDVQEEVDIPVEF